MMHMAVDMIVKRNGDVVSFDRERIETALRKAFGSGDTHKRESAITAIVDDACREINNRFVDIYPNVENVQDLVEKYLMKHEYFDIAKAYILYRHSHKQKREKEHQKAERNARLGKLKVTKRDGRVVVFDRTKISATIQRVLNGLDDSVSAELLFAEFIKNIYDGVTTRDLDRALVMAAVSYIERHPDYDTAAARFFLQHTYKEAFRQSINEELFEKEYRSMFINNIHHGVTLGMLDKRLLSFKLEAIAAALRFERDCLLGYTGLQTLYLRYFLKQDETRMELPQTFWMRVAMGLALNEANREERAVEFYNVISTLSFIPSTPTLFHAGMGHPQLSSCYLTKIDDDLTHIFKCLGDNAQYSKWSGGLGNDWTSVRATGARISTTGVESQGVVPFLKIANDVTVAINRSGKRRGATCAYLETWHLDIEDFLDLRRNTGDERRRTHDMNTANWIPDLFMKRVAQKSHWTLFSPDETPDLHDLYGRAFEERYIWYESQARIGKIIKHKVVDATALWRKMLTRLFETGHPWITFKDPCNVRSPQDHTGIVHSSNLCTEITLNTSREESAVCNLGSINVSRHVNETTFDRDKLAQTVQTAMRMLDNVVDLNFYPTEESRRANLRHRPVGMGAMGLQDALFALKMSFSQQSAQHFCDSLMEFISYHAIFSSSRLAQERGRYESYPGSKWDRGIFPIDTIALLEKERGVPVDVDRYERLDWKPVRRHVAQHGMRNSNCMAIAPTATIATIAGCYPSIEPMYKNIYVKANISGEFTVVNKYLVADLTRRELWTLDMLEQIKFNDGNLDAITAIPDDIKLLYREAFQIDPVDLLKLTALRSKWIDQSQSHNVFMQGHSGKKLSEIYTSAWKLGLKTTYYLRTLAASQIEKSTLDAKKYGFTQKRTGAQAQSRPVSNEIETCDPTPAAAPVEVPATQIASAKICDLMNPDCEACQ
ncbi:MAG: ribonucleoside-diphosphate reductase subunit alpha [Chitinivibrionales bacterium]|nr:ribonucleoside-diphosphate reductase subunit alpha [Chitinivibrionales bacterium]